MNFEVKYGSLHEFKLKYLSQSQREGELSDLFVIGKHKIDESFKTMTITIPEVTSHSKHTIETESTYTRERYDDMNDHWVLSDSKSVMSK